jgi:hypothetical protein
MGQGYYTTTIHVTTTRVILHVSYPSLTPNRSFDKKHSILGVERYAGANIFAVNVPKYPISNLIDYTKFKQYSALTASIPRKENCI